jgi:hypothetical protein
MMPSFLNFDFFSYKIQKGQIPGSPSPMQPMFHSTILYHKQSKVTEIYPLQLE